MADILRLRGCRLERFYMLRGCLVHRSRLPQDTVQRSVGRRPPLQLPPSPVVGDMYYETVYTNYRDVGS